MTRKDSIFLNDLQAFCRLGIYDSERVLGQCITINLELELDLKKAGKSNQIKDSINYVEVSIAIRELCQSKEFLMLENLAEEISQMLFDNYSQLEGLALEIHKTIVNIEQFTGKPGIRIYRTRE